MTRFSKATNSDAGSGSDKDFITVGIGASAGGIKPLQEFFRLMPPDSGMAFVVILHLSPEHESRLAAILQNETKMPVTQVNDTETVLPNHVYVIPPQRNLAMLDGTITLTEREHRRGPRVAIDTFFRTLASAHGKNSVCIIMSGTGADGTIGLKHIKERNGFAIVQDPEDAEYDGMPINAIATKLVDWILPVSAMPKKLVDFRSSSERLNLTDPDEKAPLDIKGSEDLLELIAFIRSRTGHDFSDYKQATLIRRVARHLQIYEFEDISTYLAFLREHPDDVHSLLKNLLINVTSFFRDRDTFKALASDVFPKIFEGKAPNDTVRVWSAGCSSGEEAYSLGILLSEYCDSLAEPPKFHIFATDADDDAIAEARSHRYPETIEADVSAERLKKYFRKDGEHYLIRKELREKILFAPHNLLRDPPFSRLDLVVCRNLMIYLNRDSQNHVLQIFHFALNKEGFLLLGSSESADGSHHLFTPANKKSRIYSRNAVPTPPLRASPLDRRVQPITTPEDFRHSYREPSMSFGEMHYKMVERYAPPSVLVNEDFDIVHVSESAGRYLHFSGGEPSNNLFKAVVADLVPDLRAALYAVKEDGKGSETRNIRVRVGEADAFVNLIVRPVDSARSGIGMMLIVFDEIKIGPGLDQPATGTVRIDKDEALEAVTQRLEEDLRRTKDRLRTTNEQNETSVEELKASNEELQAINEELRSTTEELETGKEELQSVNEELATVNQDLKDKVEETGRINSDLQNLMAATDIGTMFLDLELKVRLFTPSITRIFNIIPTDIGRPVAHLTHKLDYSALQNDAASVLKNLQAVEREIVDTDGESYILRFSPYRTTENVVEGIALTFINITERVAAQNNERWLSAVVKSSNDGIIGCSYTGEIVSWNPGAEAILGYSAAEVTGKPVEMLIPPDGRAEAARIHARIKDGESINQLETVRLCADGSEVNVSITMAPIRDSKGAIVGFTKVVRDITNRKNAEAAIRASEEALRRSEEHLRLLIESFTDHAIFSMALDSRIESWHAGAAAIFGYSEDEILGQPCSILFTPEDVAKKIPEKEIETARRTGRAADDRWHIRKDGTRFFVNGVMVPLFESGVHVGYAKIARDLTEQNRIAEELQRAHDELEVRVKGRTKQLGDANDRLRQEIAERKLAEEERIGLLKKIVTTQEDERRRIARDIHDQLGQRTTALRLTLASLRQDSEYNAELTGKIQTLQEISARLDSEVSFLAWELRPTVLDDLGLVDAVAAFVSEWSRHFDVPSDFHVSGFKNVRLDPEVETNLYRIMQEALNNTVKHAHATRVNVLLERRDGKVGLIIEDNGRGFDPAIKAIERRTGHGLGLIGMRERAGLVGGTVEIESSPHGGTTVYVRVPFKIAEQESNNA